MREKEKEKEKKKKVEKRLTNQNIVIEQSDRLLIGAKRSFLFSFFFSVFSSLISTLLVNKKNTMTVSPTTILIHRKIDYVQIDEIPSTKSLRNTRIQTMHTL